MKRTPLLVGLLLGPFAWAQDTTQAVTYRTVAAPAKRVLSALSKLTGVRLETNAMTEGEVLLVAVEGVPLSTLMQRIAVATSGEWQPIEGGFRLVANAAERRREAQAEVAMRREGLRKAIAQQQEALKPRTGPTKPVTPPKVGEEEKEEPVVVPALMPIARLLPSLDVSVLASLEPGDRVVFSSTPTRMQRPLRGNAVNIVTEFVAARNESLKGVQEIETPDDDQIPDFIRERLERQSQPIQKPVAKVLLVAERNDRFMMGPMESGLRLQLKLYDAQGNVLAIEEDHLGLGLPEAGGGMVGAVEHPGEGPKPPPAPNGTPIELSEDSKKLQMLLGSLGRGPGADSMSFKLDPGLRAKLFAPEAHDPLAFFPSDALFSLAKLKKRPLVAVVPDSAMPVEGIIGRGAAMDTVEAFLQSLKDGDKMVLSEADGWLVVRPARPDDARRRRVDRAALGALLRATASKEIPSLDDMAAYALRNEPFTADGAATMYLALFVPGAVSIASLNAADWDMLRFYGALDPAQKKSLLGGGRLSVGSLPPVLLALLRKMVYGAGGSLSVERPGQPPAEEEPFGFFAQMSGMFGDGGKDFRDEPTEALPNGLPPNGYLEAAAAREYFAKLADPPGTQTMSIMSVLGADEMAMFGMFRNSPAMQRGDSPFPSLDRLRVGNRTRLDFAFRLAPGLSVRKTLMDHVLPKDAPVVSEKDLPEPFRKRIAQRLEALKKSPFGRIGDYMGGGGAPPP